MGPINQGRSFKRLNELYAVNGQVGFMATERVDGKLILAETIKVLQHKYNNIYSSKGR